MWYIHIYIYIYIYILQGHAGANSNKEVSARHKYRASRTHAQSSW